jgi:hypothetical protein
MISLPLYGSANPLTFLDLHDVQEPAQEPVPAAR